MCSALQNLFDFYNKDWILTEDILEMKKKSMKSKLGPKLHSQLSTRKIRQTNQEYKLTLSRKKEVLARHNGQKFAIIWSTKIHVAIRIPKMANSAPFSPEHYFEHINLNF